MEVVSPFLVILTFLWIGFVCAISFMEAGLKFRAPGVTLPIGLSIGTIVFGVLNKIEWTFSAAIGIYHIFFHAGNPDWDTAWFVCAVLMLVVQTMWILPILSDRARKIIAGDELPPSVIHRYYILMEVIKVVALFIFGIGLFS